MWVIQEGEEGEVKATPERTRGGSAGADETAESNGGICFVARLPILQRSQHGLPDLTHVLIVLVLFFLLLNPHHGCLSRKTREWKWHSHRLPRHHPVSFQGLRLRFIPT